MKRWICSDYHLYHTNIMKYEPTRVDRLASYILEKHPNINADVNQIKDYLFNAIDDIKSPQAKKVTLLHNEMLIDLYNSVVNNQDQVYIIGDFCMGFDLFTIKNECRKFKGNKILLLGNHDKLKEQDYIKAGFVDATSRPIKIDDNVILSHYPMQIDRINKKFIYLYGHVHGKESGLEIFKNTKCVCLEKTDFKPIDLDQTIDELKKVNHFTN